MIGKKLLPILFMLFLFGTSNAQTQNKVPVRVIEKNDVYLSIASALAIGSEVSPSMIATGVGAFIDIKEITSAPDGNSVVTVIETAASSELGDHKTVRLKFAPPKPNPNPDVEKIWIWKEFEHHSKFYPVEKLLPFATEHIELYKKSVQMKWDAITALLIKHGESGAKILMSAKVIMKAEPELQKEYMDGVAEVAKAIESKDKTNILAAYSNLEEYEDSLLDLVESNAELKGNEELGRVVEEYKRTKEAVSTSKDEYVKTIDVYNDVLVRLPYGFITVSKQYMSIEKEF